MPNTFIYKLLSKVIVPFLAGVLLGHILVFLFMHAANAETPLTIPFIIHEKKTIEPVTIGDILEQAIAKHPKGSNEQVRLNSSNTVTFRGVVTDSSTTDVLLSLTKLVVKRGNATYPIYLVLDSPGGAVDAGLSFIEVAKVIPNLRTISLFAASMASAIVEAIPGSRLITGNGVIMFHRAAGQFAGQFEVGELETRVEEAKVTVRGMEQSNASRMGMSLMDYKAKVVNEWWIHSEEAIRKNAADKIVDIVCSTELIESRSTIEVESMFGSASYTFSDCPTFRYPIRDKKQKAELSL